MGHRGGNDDPSIDGANRHVPLAESRETSESIAAPIIVKETGKSGGRRQFFLRCRCVFFRNLLRSRTS